MKKEMINDFTLRVTQSNRSQLVVVIYDIITAYLDDAEQFFNEGQEEEYIESVKKCRSFVGELMEALDMKYPIAADLMHIYIYINKLLIFSVVKKAPQDFDAIRRMIGNLSEAFKAVAMQDKSGPLMNNTQQVFAGLTYGRGTLNESYNDQGANRGFRV